MYNAVILVVDDEQTYLSSIAETLKERKFKIIQALDGKMGIAVAKKFLPDIIIADWEMPEMNGLKMIQELKSDKTTKDIPVIMCTGIMTTSENLDTALEAGASDYIRKPIDAIELTARINAALNLSSAFKKIKAQNEELVKLNDTKNKFFSIISHDLRGPFSGIVSLTELLCDNVSELDSAEIEKFLYQIHESSKNVHYLLENLLDWARNQMNKIEFKLEEINLELIIRETIDTLKDQAFKKNLTISYNIEYSESLYSDKNIIKTILRNLVSNAIKFTQNNENIAIGVSRNSSEIEISVKDNGIGMNQNTLDKIFRIDEKTTTRGTNGETGTGLGLILCNEFVEKLGGKIWVESAVGNGSNFKFIVPLNKNSN